MGDRRQVYSERHPWTEFTAQGDVERLEITAYALTGSSDEKIREVVGQIKGRLEAEGVKILSVEAFEEPAVDFPFIRDTVSWVTIVVRAKRPPTLGALISLLALGAMVIGILAAGGFVVWNVKKTVEKMGSGGFSLIALAGLLFGAAAALREFRKERS